jgi:hypothetical protein
MLMQIVDIGVFNNMQLIKIKQPLESIYHEKLPRACRAFMLPA